MMNFIKKYISAKDGNVAMMFGILLVPMFMAIGVGIDYSRLSSAHKNLQDAADSAALGAALALLEDGPQKMKSKGRDTFIMNAGQNADVSISKINVKKTKSNTVKLVSEASLNPMFVQVFGYPKLDLKVSSEASIGAFNGLEIAIAFDSTNSMNFDSRWDTAMTSVNNTLKNMKDLSGKNGFHITLVPFTDRINIGSSNTSWLDGPAPSGWEGCVEPREEQSGAFDWAVDDDDPRSEPFTATIPGVSSFWGTYSCVDVPITGPTKHVNEITTAINSMSPEGTGRIDTGMAWAWRALSPKWRGEWGVNNYPANNNAKARKKIIFISDGNTEAYTYSMSNESTWGHNLGSIVAFEHLVELCRKAKDSGVEIYMLKLDGNPHADDYFRQCASSVDHYYSLSDAADMTVTFGDILEEMYAELRVVR